MQKDANFDFRANPGSTDSISVDCYSLYYNIDMDLQMIMLNYMD